MKEKTKNKILLIVICLFTIGLLYCALKINQKRLNEISDNSIVDKYLTEIKYEEIQTYIAEQPEAIIYVSNSSDEKSIDFEHEFKKVIKNYNLENEIIYININKMNLIDPFYQNAPQLIFYKDKEVSDIIDCATLISKQEIINVLKERSVIND